MKMRHKNDRTISLQFTLKYLLARRACQVFCFLMSILLAVTGAGDWFTASLLVLSGVSLDIYRNTRSLDLILTEGAFLSAIRSTPEKLSQSNFLVFSLRFIGIVWVVYILIFIVFEPYIGDRTMIKYLNFTSIITSIGWHVSPVIARQFYDLVSHGYIRRSLVVAHVYSLDYVLLFLVLLTWSVLDRSTNIALDKRVFLNNFIRHDKRSENRLIITAAFIAVLLQIVPNYMIKMSWDGKSTDKIDLIHIILSPDYYVQYSNLYLILFSFIIMFDAIILLSLYQLLLDLRIYGQITQCRDESMGE